MALTALGLVQARRGAGAEPALDEALALARAGRLPRTIAETRAARAEAAWLAGDVNARRRGRARGARGRLAAAQSA